MLSCYIYGLTWLWCLWMRQAVTQTLCIYDLCLKRGIHTKDWKAWSQLLAAILSCWTIHDINFPSLLCISQLFIIFVSYFCKHNINIANIICRRKAWNVKKTSRMGILEILRGTLLRTQMLSELIYRFLRFSVVVAVRPSGILGLLHSVTRVMWYTSPFGNCLACE